MKFYKFSCGCQFPIIEESTPEGVLPLIKISEADFSESCSATWELLSQGKTKGVFQLESGLGKSWTKKLKPNCIEHLGALGSVLRPGSLYSKDSDGISMTEHYCRRKNKEEEVSPYHPVIDECLRKVYGCLIYQENALEISVKAAGFNPIQADALRKSIGKKLADEMAKCKKMFLEKAEEAKILSKEQAEEVFGWIEKSQRYSFNKCISGKEIIRRDNKNKFGTVLTIEEMYFIKNSMEYAKKTGHLALYKKWKLYQNYGKGLSLNGDGRARLNYILDIQPQGKQQIYRITLENNSYIDVNQNHSFPTNQGIKRVFEFNNNTKLYICAQFDFNDKKYGFSGLPKKDVQNKWKPGIAVNNSFGVNNFGYTNGSWTDFQESIQILERRCVDCGKTEGRIEYHHKNGDRTFSKPENIDPLCPSCHKKREYKAGRRRKGEKGFPTFLLKIKSIEYIGEENVYDVTMDGPNHTFTTSQNIITCNSHAIAYGLLGFQCAYLKAHFPLMFFGNWLKQAHNKQKPQKEIQELVEDAKLFDIVVEPPDIRRLYPHFSTDRKKIYFGIVDIDGIGDAQYYKLEQKLKNYEFSKKTFYDFLLEFYPGITSNVLSRLIKVGAMRVFGEDRQHLLKELEVFEELSPKELEWFQKRRQCVKDPTLLHGLKLAACPKKNGGACANKNRINVLKTLISIFENPPTVRQDTPLQIAYDEENLLGISLTFTKIDSCDTSSVNTTCKDFVNGKEGLLILGIEIKAIREIKCKNTKKMAFITGGDASASLDFVCFPDTWAEFKGLLYEGNTVIIKVSRTKQNTASVEKVWQTC